jgi:hypothetical protein
MIDPLFHLFPFIFGIFVGLILLYSFKDQKNIIIDYPKPNDNTIYTDKNGTKFQYVTKIVDCDKNESTLRSYPIQ